ncbi:MAG: leucine-rich repeat domain-containing protein [Alterinioella nitratireducens]|uniref:leucine-rich repeat domain-containing protein n=1 Tax=Alterinioella nitratireducens TaxID=2735915 RepID=UPI00405A05B3
MTHRLATFPALGLAAALLMACQTTGNTATRASQELGADRLAACEAGACDRLNLDGASLRDYSVLAEMDHITALMISYTDFSDLGQIAPMRQLRELHIGSSAVTDLSGLAAFPDLTVLHAQWLPARDHGAIGGLTGLRELAVGGSNLTDLGFIADLPRLERLNLTLPGEGLTLEALRGHPALRTVHLDNTGLTDLSVFETLPRLRELSLTEFDTPALQAQIARLRARGITVTLDEPVMVVC